MIQNKDQDFTQGYLQEQLEYAKTKNDNSLQRAIDRLNKIDEFQETTTTISRDFTPRSFYFARTKDGQFRGNGGIIFHGHHDNGGDGGAPTFSVCLTPVNGWSIHT